MIKDSNGDSLTLVKSDTLWSILYHDSLEVKDRQLDQFFEKVIGGTFDMMMSKNAKKWAKFGADDSSGKRGSFQGDNKLLLLYLVIREMIMRTIFLFQLAKIMCIEHQKIYFT